MNSEDKIKAKFGTKTGFTVPDNYFEDIYKRIETNLPPLPAYPKPQKLSRWQRVKPYVYLAAMFAGIWCMMKMFNTMTSNTNVSLDNPPALVAQAMQEQTNFDEVILSSNSTDYELEDAITESYDSFSQFEEDFGYEVSDEYADITIPE